MHNASRYSFIWQVFMGVWVNVNKHLTNGHVTRTTDHTALLVSICLSVCPSTFSFIYLFIYSSRWCFPSPSHTWINTSSTEAHNLPFLAVIKAGKASQATHTLHKETAAEKFQAAIWSLSQQMRGGIKVLQLCEV